MDIIWDDDVYTDAVMILFQDDDDDHNRSDAHQECENEAETPENKFELIFLRLSYNSKFLQQRAMYPSWQASPI
jgi:hypothetical protein